MTGLDLFFPCNETYFLYSPLTWAQTTAGGKLGLASGCPAEVMGWFPKPFSEECRTGMSPWTLLSAQQKMVEKSSLWCFGKKGKSARKTGSSPARAGKPNSALFVQSQTHRRREGCNWGPDAFNLLTTFLDYSRFLPGYLYIINILANNDNVVRFPLKTLKVWVSQTAFHMLDLFYGLFLKY